MPSAAIDLTIGALAKAAGVSVETIRFYQRKGLLQEPDRPPGGIRRYRDAHLARVHFIKAAQRLGFTLLDVAELLRLEDGTNCGEARRLAEDRLRDVRDRLASLQHIESALRQVVAHCSVARGQVKCPLIACLQQA